MSQWEEERRKGNVGNVSPFEFCICPMQMSKPVELGMGQCPTPFSSWCQTFLCLKFFMCWSFLSSLLKTVFPEYRLTPFILEKIFKFYKVEVELNQVNHRLARFQKVYQGKMKIFRWQQMYEQKTFGTLGNTTLVYTMD